MRTVDARFRPWLAEKLWPEVFAEARRGRHLQDLVADLRWWCAEFPDVGAAAEWALASTASRYRALGEPAHDAACDISEFREKLRRRHWQDPVFTASDDCRQERGRT